MSHTRSAGDVSVTSDVIKATGQEPAVAVPQWLRRIFWANLVAQTAIVVTGGLVRLTGSGLGCPTWPQCSSASFVPTAGLDTATHKYIEFGNRTLTFVLTIIAIAAFVGTLRWNARLKAERGATRRPLTWLAATPLLGTVAQAVLGGITVLTGLNPLFVSAHYLVSSGLIAASMVLLVRSRELGDHPVTLTVHPVIRRLGTAIVALALVVLTVGTLVTGSGPHSGDADATHRLPFDPRMISWLHADLVLLFIGLTVGLIIALTVTRAPKPITGRAIGILVISLLQGTIGYVQFFIGLPWVIVLLHLLGSTLVWIAVLSSYLSLRVRGTAEVATHS